MDYLISNNMLSNFSQTNKTIFCLVLGLIIGSFLNVVIYRLPLILDNRKQPNMKSFNLCLPPSHCPKCKVSIAFWANIPLLGYIILRGKCLRCKQTISIRYLVIELFTGLLFAICSYPIANIYLLVASLVFISFCICAIVIDYDTYYLPDELTLPLLWLGLIFNLDGMISGSLKNSVIGAVIGYLSLWTIFWLFKLLTKKDGMGYGDFKFLAAILAFLGIKAIIPVILLASIMGIVYAVIVRIFQLNDKHQVEIPFGPFLGTVAIFFLIINQYYVIQY